MKKSVLALLSLPLLLAAADIYMMGDSTMQGYDKSLYPLSGWGAKLQIFCKKGVKVHNLSRSGASSKSYYSHHYYQLLKNAVKPGDYVFIQFGHNDAHNDDARHTDPDTTFQEYLKKFINEARARKCIPVLLTQTTICRFKDGRVCNTAKEQGYIDATRKVAGDMNVELIDHNAWALKNVSKLGKRKAEKLYMYLEKGKYKAYPNGREDDCHLNEQGAEFFAAGAVKQAKDSKLKVAKLFK